MTIILYIRNCDTCRVFSIVRGRCFHRRENIFIYFTVAMKWAVASYCGQAEGRSGEGGREAGGAYSGGYYKNIIILVSLPIDRL